MIIYKTINLINNKFYIGQDSNNNPDYLGSGLLLKRAIEKYGRENFKKETLEVCDNKEQLNLREIHWIEYTSAKTEGYNIADGGHGGNTYTEETRKRISELFKGREISEETRKKISILNKGRVQNLSEEQRLARSNKLKELRSDSEFMMSNKIALENCNRDYSKCTLHCKGNSYMLGKKHTEETKKKMSESHKENPVSFWENKKFSDEHKQNISDALKGKKRTTEQREKNSGEGNPFFGKNHSDDTKKKMSETIQNRTPEQKLEKYIKFLFSRTGKELTDEEKSIKLEEYRNMVSC
jgi:group I intron endonuclease